MKKFKLVGGFCVLFSIYVFYGLLNYFNNIENDLSNNTTSSYGSGFGYVLVSMIFTYFIIGIIFLFFVNEKKRNYFVTLSWNLIFCSFFIFVFLAFIGSGSMFGRLTVLTVSLCSLVSVLVGLKYTPSVKIS